MAGFCNPEEAKEEGPLGIQSVEIGGRLLAALAKFERQASLTELAGEVGMPPSKARRYLVSLMRSGLVAQARKSGLYDVGPLTFMLGLAALKRIDLLKSATERLALIRDRTGEACALTVWNGREPTVVAFEPSPLPISLSAKMGSTLPALTTATGLAFLAFLPEAEVIDILKQDYKTSDDDLEALRTRLKDIQEQGWVSVSNHYRKGITGTSAPVKNALGGLVSVITVLSMQNDSAAVSQHAQILREEIQQIGPY